MTSSIARDVKLLKVYALGSSLALIIICVMGFQSNDSRRNVAELDVQRLNIVDGQGHKLIVLSNKDRFPLPVVNGKEYPRSINPCGIVFYDEHGTECGGIAVATLPKARRTAIIFDYSNTEAIGFSAYETHGGDFGAGMSIQDRNPLDADIMKVGTEGTNRISLQNESKTAEVALSDAKGNPRIRLRVDSAGAAAMASIALI